MFNRSWIPSSLREFINERVLKRKPLRSLSPDGPKNLRDSLPTKADRHGLHELAVEDGGPQIAEPAYKEEWKRKPLPMLPSHETFAGTLPADNPLGITIPSTTSDIASQRAGCPTGAAFHPGNPNRTSRGETLCAFAGFFEADDNDNDFKPELNVPVRASELTNSTDWPGHAILLCNPAFLTRLTDLLQSRKAYEKASCDANLIKSVTDTFALKLKMEITKTEIRLHRFYPDVQLARQYNVYESATSGPSATALKLERKREELRSFLERAAVRCAGIFTTLEQQAQNLRAAQAAVNADLEKAFAAADMLRGEIDAPKGAQASDVISEYKAFCRQNGVKWDGGESEKLPESLRVGPAVKLIDGKDVYELA
ncbi:hypothetical protein MBLNU13_g08094t1 [Cladosporium sp. NU13]